MREKLVAPVMAVGLGLTMAGCGEDVNPEISAAHNRILETYNCDVDPASIEVTNLSQESLAAFGDETTGKAMTDAEGIRLNDRSSFDEMASLVIHESFHWCADRDTSADQSIIVPNVGVLSQTDGFTLFFDGNTTQGTTHVEEGVVEWLSLQQEGYQPHADYAVLAEVTDLLAEKRELSDQQVVDLLKNDDFIGYVGLLKNKPADEVTGQDVFDIANLYIESYNANTAPSESEISDLLNS